MDLSKLPTSDLLAQIKVMAKSQQWPYFAEFLNRELAALQGPIKKVNDLHTLGKLQGKILTYDQILQLQ